jgi:D-alanyl-D-alanine carboxypeptidase/D-alanyl-D-alanine-endopeptidase (penicillin-binding protein 4)
MAGDNQRRQEWRRGTHGCVRHILAVACFLTVAAPAADLAHAIDTLVDSSNPIAAYSNFGIHVVDLKTGKPLYARNETRLFLPASNMKLFTTALALLKLGPAYRFETRLIQEPSGDLVLVGSGDPSMSGRPYPYSPGVSPLPPLHAIEELADEAIANGLTSVQGDIVGDDRLYPWSPYPPSWTQSDPLGESGAPVSALSVADNFITVNFAPGAKPGDLATLSLSPPLEYFAIDNRILTVAGGGEAHIGMTRAPGTRQLLFDGTIPAAATKVYANVTVDDPALYAACALYDALARRGVMLAGRPVARHRAAGDAYTAPEAHAGTSEAPAEATILATRFSPPAAELIQTTDKVSENLHAELLLREAGRIERGAGTREAGLAALNAFLIQIGAASNDSRIDDGSGLSRNTLVTPQLVTRLLGFMYGSNSYGPGLHDAWIAMLPVGGEDGTLARRFRGAKDARAIHAKTGTLNRAIALSGYAESKTRGWLAFSILVNDFAAPQSEIQSWVDKIALALLQ